MTSVLQDFIISLHRDVQVMFFIHMLLNIRIIIFLVTPSFFVFRDITFAKTVSFPSGICLFKRKAKEMF